MIRRFLYMASGALVLALTALPATTMAATAVVYVSPPSGRVPVGNIIPVQVRVNSGTDPINAVEANLSYDGGKLAYRSVDATGSFFTLAANQQSAAGSLSIARATGPGEPAVKGDNLFITVLFEALTTDGTASVAVRNDSHVARSTDSVDIIKGAPAASGPLPVIAAQPTPKSYAPKKGAGSGSPAPDAGTPATAANASPGASVQPTAAGLATDSVGTGQTAQPLSDSTGKYLGWKSPWAWGGGILLLLALGGTIYVLWRRRLKNAAVVVPPGALVMPDPNAGQITKDDSLDQ